MSMQQPDGSMLTFATAVSLLRQWLKERGLKASSGLSELFGEAGRLAEKRAPGRRLVSTRILLLAATELGTRIQPLDPESRALKAVADVLGRNAERLEQLKAGYFKSTKVASGKPPALTDNVARMLERAASEDAPDAERGLLTAVQFLLVYPLAGSKAGDMLDELDIAVEELRTAVLDAAAEPPALQGDREQASIANDLSTGDTLKGQASRDEAAIGGATRGEGADTGKTAGQTANGQPTGRTTEATGKRFDERVSTHTDEPATADQLGRRNFAQVLAMRIKQARPADSTNREAALGARLKPWSGRREKAKKAREEKKPAFIVHLHGPWGSGKSSVLNFLEEELERNSDPPWIVVSFNAWRQQRLHPPWWTLITTIYSGARAKLGWRAPMLWLKWQMWRIRADYVPFFAVLVFLSLVAMTMIGFGYFDFARDAAPAGGRPTLLDTMLKLAPVGITILAGIWVGSRALALGSRRAAQTYADLKDDPYKPITKLFEDLVHAIGRPLAVFVDDLDRCGADYVVDLLEGVQTLMRGAPVTYVVAADRKWICSSFEQRYAGYSEPIGEPGRPLGYLFLDKMFQVSAAIPQPSPEARSSYWLNLLHATPAVLEQHEQRVKEAEKAADAQAKKLKRPEDMREMVRRAETQAKISKDPLIVPAARAAAAKQIASQAAEPELEHRLKSFDDLLEPNPRAMKRLVNAYAMHQSTLFLSGSDAVFATLARWTILELRWPQLADFLATRPECVDALRSPLKDGESPQVPQSLRRLFGDKPIIDVLGRKGEGALDADGLKAILGSVQGER